MIVLCRQFCENEHLRMGVGYDTDCVTPEAAETVITLLLQTMRAGPCNHCRSQTWHWDHWKTPYDTLEEANAYLAKIKTEEDAKMTDPVIRKISDALWSLFKD